MRGTSRIASPAISAMSLSDCIIMSYIDSSRVEYFWGRWGFHLATKGHLMRDPQSDAVLLTRLQGGDERAVAELATTYGSKIYQLAFRYLRNKEDAEEVTQDVLYKVYRKIDAFRGDAALSSWIYRITFNAAMSRLRTAKYQRAQNEEPQLSVGGDNDEMSRPARKEIADWSD